MSNVRPHWSDSVAIVIVWNPGTLGHYAQSFRVWLRRLTRSRIFSAIEQGDEALVLRLATPKILSQAKNEWGQTPLEASILHKRSQIACLLVERGGYSAQDEALAQAAMCNDFAASKKLVEAGAPLDNPDRGEHGWTALMWATNRRHFEIMKLLLNAGANVNAVGKDGTTAVMCTSAGKDDDLVALDILCAYQPALTTKDWRGRTILDEARDRARFSNKTAMQDILHKHYPSLGQHEA
jgi:uncharacterized protein